ncbi:MAG: hypothetical protein H8D23_35390 [Candidatus Brocadiales bacterium]|nr:hypothetical protein [Candidatus Brocadiales bacterium]
MNTKVKMPEIVRVGDATYLGTPVTDKSNVLVEVKDALRVSSTPDTSELRQFISASIGGELEPSVTVGGAIATSIMKLKVSLQAKWKMYIITLETAEAQAMPNLIRQAFNDLSRDLR